MKWTNVPTSEANLTLCYLSFQAIDMQISATSTNIRTEPAFRADTDSMDTSNILRQLGVDNTQSTHVERGIMTLDLESSWARGAMIANGVSHALDGIFGFMVADERTGQDDDFPAPTYSLCSGCGRNMTLDELRERGWVGVERIDSLLARIFQDTLKKSRNPATAVQALFMVANLMKYYSR